MEKNMADLSSSYCCFFLWSHVALKSLFCFFLASVSSWFDSIRRRCVEYGFLRLRTGTTCKQSKSPLLGIKQQTIAKNFCNFSGASFFFNSLGQISTDNFFQRRTNFQVYREKKDEMNDKLHKTQCWTTIIPANEIPLVPKDRPVPNGLYGLCVRIKIPWFFDINGGICVHALPLLWSNS